MDYSAGSPVFVGVDGSKAALEAAIWAADEAIVRNAPIVLLSAVDPYRGDLDVALTEARRAIGVAADTVKQLGRPLKIEYDVVLGDPVQVLGKVAHDAAMVCIGRSCSPSQDSAAPKQSMATQLIRNSLAAVAVVQRRQLHTTSTPDRWVVALLEATLGEDRVLHGAVGEGLLRGAAVMALTQGGDEFDDASVERLHASLGRRLASVEHANPDLEIWAMPYPDDVLGLLLQEPTVDHLVVAGPTHRDLIDELLSAEASSVLRDTNCSILVLHDCDAGRTGD